MYCCWVMFGVVGIFILELLMKIGILNILLWYKVGDVMYFVD